MSADVDLGDLVQPGLLACPRHLQLLLAVNRGPEQLNTYLLLIINDEPSTGFGNKNATTQNTKFHYYLTTTRTTFRTSTSTTTTTTPYTKH